MSKSDGSAGRSGSARVKEPITPGTLIAEVVDYPLELYARERARAVEEGTNGSGIPGWVVVAALVGFAVFTALALSQGLAAMPTLIALGALVVGLGALLHVRSTTFGTIPQERVRELEALDRRIRDAFAELGIKCHGCGAAYVETFERGAVVHGFDAEQVVAKLNTLGIDLSLTKHDPPGSGADTAKADGTKGK